MSKYINVSFLKITYKYKKYIYIVFGRNTP